MKLRYTVTLSFLLVVAAFTVQAQIPNYTPNVVTAMGPVNFPANAAPGPTFIVTPPTGSTTSNGSVQVVWNTGTGTRVRAVAFHGGILFTGAAATVPSGVH